MTDTSYDALLVVSFGGPEGPDEVMPFLENVLRGRNVPRERMLQVAEHYQHFGGVSPINQQNRDLIAALEAALKQRQIDLPVYWGNRNWHPLLPDTVRQMQHDGIRNALAYVTAAYSSYSSCRQYRQNILDARAEVGSGAPRIDKIRAFYNHPLFIAANADRVRSALAEFEPNSRARPRLVFTAHSIPESMSAGCDYAAQLAESSRLVAEAVGQQPSDWDLVYQSRSGRPQDPWLGPDICDHLSALAEAGIRQVVIVPIGFLSDHMEVLYDLDCEAAQVSQEHDMQMIRAGTVGTHPLFIEMLVQLIEERLDPGHPRQAVGQFGPRHNICPEDCCPAPVRPGVRPAK